MTLGDVACPPPNMQDACTREVDELVKALAADPEHGLTGAEARRRLFEDGPNELRSAPRLPAWRRVLKHFQDPLIYLLLVAIAIALLAWGMEVARLAG